MYYTPDKNFRELAHVVATSRNGIIGLKGIMPWHIPEDLARFKYLTTGKTVIMGRTTYENLPKKLEHRKIVVISSSKAFKEGVEVFKSLDEALKSLSNDKHIMISGGESIYKQSINLVSAIYLTLIHSDIEGDASYFTLDELLKNFKIDYERKIDSVPVCSFIRLVRN